MGGPGDTAALVWFSPCGFPAKVGAVGGPPGVRPLRFRNGAVDPGRPMLFTLHSALFFFPGKWHPSARISGVLSRSIRIHRFSALHNLSYLLLSFQIVNDLSIPMVRIYH